MFAVLCFLLPVRVPDEVDEEQPISDEVKPGGSGDETCKSGFGSAASAISVDEAQQVLISLRELGEHSSPEMARTTVESIRLLLFRDNEIRFRKTAEAFAGWLSSCFALLRGKNWYR